jgi:hypothetical protein
MFIAPFLPRSVWISRNRLNWNVILRWACLDGHWKVQFGSNPNLDWRPSSNARATKWNPNLESPIPLLRLVILDSATSTCRTLLPPASAHHWPPPPISASAHLLSLPASAHHPSPPAVTVGPSRMRRMTAQGPCSCHQRSDPPGSSSTSSQVRALLLTHTSRSSKCLHHRCSSPSLLRFSGVR